MTDATPGQQPPAASSSNLHYDYKAAEDYATQLNLGWLGPTWLIAFDTEAFALGMTQQQIDMVFRHHLWHIALLSNPKTYSWLRRIAFAFYWLTGWKVNP